MNSIDIALPSFLDEVIRRGIEEVQTANHKPHEKEGAIEGFNLCRGKTLDELRKLYQEQCIEINRNVVDVNDKRITPEEYWKQRYKQLQIEFVCNCVSYLCNMLNHLDKRIMIPTVRGARQTTTILADLAARN